MFEDKYIQYSDGMRINSISENYAIAYITYDYFKEEMENDPLHFEDNTCKLLQERLTTDFGYKIIRADARFENPLDTIEKKNKMIINISIQTEL